ncbi:MAG: transketolase [Candidatus Aminicenantes bacterium RBG_13_63_10]|nr:MAG: transketolase [Candidatus Aminicenantes bacterium RBG_13_63_10]
MENIEALEKIAKRLRIHSLVMTTKAGSGHPSTCLSMAEILTCLFFHEMQFNPRDPQDWANDELVLSKGHAAPILWAAYAEAGIIPLSHLPTLRLFTSSLEGHPTPRMKWIKAATGSLGQGLSVAAGLAAAMKLGRSPARVYAVLGDGECAEGSGWEAAHSAWHLKLANLCAVVDINRLGQSEPTMHEHDIDAYARKFRAFGWEAFPVDGHSLPDILAALDAARQTSGPAVLLARTIKGKGVSFIENKNGWHGKPLKDQELQAALEELGPMPEVDAKALVRRPPSVPRPAPAKRFRFKRTDYRDKTATRLAYGQSLVSLGKVNESVVAIDGDVKNSTYADKFFETFPDRSYQSYIAEQNMVGLAIGFSAKGFVPFLATFSAFLSRGHDQVRMAAYSAANLKIAGSHCGVSIGEDGPSQMGLEDLAMFRSIPGCVVLYPSDAFATEGCVEAMAAHRGLAYIRTTRPATPLLYSKGENFPLGGSKVLRSSRSDMAVVVAAGITVFEALKAYEVLKAKKIPIRVVDAYSIEPLDADGLLKHSRACRGRVVVVEDHFPHGGLGEAAAAALAGSARVEHLCIRELPRSGKPEELLDAYGINARAIVQAVKKLTGKGR